MTAKVQQHFCDGIRTECLFQHCNHQDHLQ